MTKLLVIPFTILLLFITGCQWLELNHQSHVEIKPKPYKIEPLNERAPQPTVELHRPFDFPLFLSGNFGELRSNHFHGGIDFKTQGSIGHPIHCADDGYISQVSVSGGGYGKAIYVVHPSLGLTTVYGHLENFSPMIDSIVNARQYELETFAITLRFPIDAYPVKKGDIIAYSGNTGYSLGPHLHMEVRHTATGDALDPLPYFKSLITDNVAPTSHALILYPHKTEGLVNGTTQASYQITVPEGTHSFTAWGKVYPAIRANDYMTDSYNVYGVKHLVLKVDGTEVYRRTIDRFRMEATRAINTLVDYRDLKNTQNWNMYTRIPSSKPLGVMIESTTDDGAINITEQRPYNCEFIMSDEYGNTTSVPFIINGVEANIPTSTPSGKLIKLNNIDTLNIEGLSLKFYEGCFYENIYIDVKCQKTSQYNSAIYSIGDYYTPLARSYRMAIKVNNDTINDKSKYCIVRTNGITQSAISSRYKNGEMIGYAYQFGSYAVTTDLIAPTILPINSSLWGINNTITFKINDNLSGIKNYRGTIDGKWVKFEASNLNSTVTFNITPDKITKGGSHKVDMTVTDNCGNIATKTVTFVW